MNFLLIFSVRNVEFTSIPVPQPEANDLYAYLKQLERDYTQVSNVWMTPEYSLERFTRKIADRRSGARDEHQCIDVCKVKPGTACAMSAHWCMLKAPHEGRPHLFPCDGEAQ